MFWILVVFLIGAVMLSSVVYGCYSNKISLLLDEIERLQVARHTEVERFSNKLKEKQKQIDMMKPVYEQQIIAEKEAKEQSPYHLDLAFAGSDSR